MKNYKRCFLRALLFLALLVAGSGLWQKRHPAAEMTNQQQIYAYLTGEMGFNAAAACGIMANIERESDFNPQVGGSFYGLFQWGGSRKSELIRFCEENGFDHGTIEGQMHYLEQELDNGYRKVKEHLLQIENTPEGAYEAGYYWCYYFEMPGDIETASALRGALARDRYWPNYNPSALLPFMGHIDSPEEGKAYTGTVVVKGWAICGLEITKVTAYVNEKKIECSFKPRGDVSSVHPGYPEGKEGFIAYIPSSCLREGGNEVVVCAYCGEAEYSLGKVSFTCSDLDITPPKISNVQITDITENGYTVTCTMEDENGIDRVQFPTWTEKDGQDDIDPNWEMSEQSRGIMSDGIVTYQVRTRNHKYEGGTYNTHIYAYDVAGNKQVAVTECVVPEREVYFGSVVSEGAVVTSEDALAVLKFVVKLAEPDERQALAADVNGDQSITSEDALLILKKVVKLLEFFPVEQ